jgi:tetratricopeptide (TPR) repeat protein
MPAAAAIVPAMMQFPSKMSVVAVVGVLILLTGCATTDGKPDQAKAAKELPGDPNALLLGAEVSLQHKQYLEAARAYTKAATLVDDESLADQATRVAYDTHQTSLVLVNAKRWLELNPTNEDAHRFAAFSALRLYQIDEATVHLHSLLDKAYLNPQAGFVALASQLSEEGSPAAVTAAMKKLVDFYPDMAEAHYALGQSALESDNFALALEHAKRAHELSPFWAPAGLLLARIMITNGDLEGGVKTAKAVVDQDAHPGYRLEYAVMLLAAGRTEESRKELVALSKQESTSAAAERALALIDFQNGDREAALQRFNDLLSSGHFVYESLFYIASMAESREAWDEALQTYGRITGGDSALTAQIRAARIKAKQGGVKAGLKSLEDFGDDRPQFTIDLINARAALMAEMGDHTGAVALLTSSIEQYPDAFELRFSRSLQFEQMDRVDDSIRDLRELVRLRPEDPAALNALGYTLVDRTSHAREGLKYVEAAYAETPDNGAVLDSMGWGLHRTGRDAEALKYLELSQRRIPDPEIDLHYGDVLAALGRRPEAEKVWREALERYPDNADLKKRLSSTKSR